MRRRRRGPKGNEDNRGRADAGARRDGHRFAFAMTSLTLGEVDAETAAARGECGPNAVTPSLCLLPDRVETTADLDVVIASISGRRPGPAGRPLSRSWHSDHA